MIRIETKKFNDLSLLELYEIMVLRQEVFVVEQDCPYLDADGKDEKALHMMIYDQKDMLAYARLFPEKLVYKDFASIGRVVVPMSERSKGYGKRIMIEAVDYCIKVFRTKNIRISAQTHHKGFYESLGFSGTGEYYLEDDIPHMAMIYAKKG